MDRRVVAANIYTRIKTSTLRRLGLRNRVLRSRLKRERDQRAAAEKKGDDRLSRPALHGLDVKLGSIVGREDGFFVEAGAHDGFTQSNTYWLERFHGWQGLLIEPLPELAAEARLSRPGAVIAQCALVAAETDEQTVRMRAGDLFSMVKGARPATWTRNGTFLGWRDEYELDVEARTLSSLLDEIHAPEVDLLSLDVEGFEVSALEGLDLERHAPRYIIVEIHEPEQRKPGVDALLAERYAEHGWLSPVDILYVRRYSRVGPYGVNTPRAAPGETVLHGRDRRDTA